MSFQLIKLQLKEFHLQNQQFKIKICILINKCKVTYFKKIENRKQKSNIHLNFKIQLKINNTKKLDLQPFNKLQIYLILQKKVSNCKFKIKENLNKIMNFLI